MKKTRRMKLSFSKDEIFRASLDLRNSGISMPLMDDESAKREFNVKNTAESFGFFGSGNNANTFHPDITIPDHIQPKPEDFVRVPFRLLSATTVGAGTWKATDFSNERVLRASLNDLDKKPIYFDHDTELLNWVGIIESVQWSPAKGDTPAGINGLLAIDAKTNPKIARGVLIGSIFSNSVTVEFDWEPSHSFDDPYEFNDKMGTIDPRDGQMVRRIVKKIHNYHETSLVWLGADPYAKLIDENGDLTHVDKSSTYKLEKDEVKQSYEKDNRYAVSFSMPKSVIDLSKRTQNNKRESNNSINNKQESMNKELEIALRKVLGVDENQELSKELIESLELKDDNVTSDAATFGKLKSIDSGGNENELSEVTEGSHIILAKADFDNLSTEAGKVESLGSLAEVGKNLLEAERAEVERLYSLSVENDTEEEIVTLIKNATPKQLAAFKKQYTKSATSEFTGTCKSCGGNEFEFRSSQDGDDEGKDEVVESASYEQLMDKFGSPSMNLQK